MTTFIHLRMHSEFSLVDSTVRFKPLAKRLTALQQPAMALTDQSNMFGVIRFYKTMLASGLKPLIGVDVWLQRGAQAPLSRALLLAMNHAGYLSLSRLVSKSYMQGQTQDKAVIQWDWLTLESQHLIALCGAREGEIGQALLSGDRPLAEGLLSEWKAVFKDRFYLEIQRTGRLQEVKHGQAVVSLAETTQTPLVATNDVRFIDSADFEAHEVRVCIHGGFVLGDSRRPKVYSDQQYCRSSEEMAVLFADLPEALENTLHIAQRCNVEIELGKNYLPDFPVPPGLTLDEFFVRESKKGLDERLAFLFDPQSPEFAHIHQQYHDRLDFELNTIVQMGFPGYFMIVADFIQWSKDQAIPVGPGRGSGAGSLVAYALKITDLDPIRYALLFERFLNPERVSMPDFDIDFCMDRRDEVIDYVARKYGRNQVSQIITYGTLAAKAAIRDVGRVLGHPYGFVDRISKMIPDELGISIGESLEKSTDLREKYEQDDEVRELLDMALKLEGLTRNAGKHAGGVVISPSDLTDFAPLYCEAGSASIVTQYDKKDVEDVGLVKFDFLGLRTLTIIDWALQMINEGRQATDAEFVDIARIPLDDQRAFDLLKKGETTAVFQLESRGIKELIKNLKPSVFEDIIALVALYRPGPLGSGMVDDFIARKHGKQAISYPHPWLAEVLEETYGTILYQEQVMQIAQILAKYTLGGADMLRRAMGKKIPEEMAKQRSIFEAGCAENGIDAALASSIFDTMEEFAKYGFNKSHSAAYALVSYQTLWLKVHHPEAFMAAVMNSEMDNTDKLFIFVEEVALMGMKLLAPNVNTGFSRFRPAGQGQISYGLAAIKGVGETATLAIEEARGQEGAFQSLADFCIRVDSKRVNRRAIENLIRAGALDCLGMNRASLLANLSQALHQADQHQRNQDQGQEDLFGALDLPQTEMTQDLPWTMVREMRTKHRLEHEKQALGFFLSGHPFDEYCDEFRALGFVPLDRLTAAKDKNERTKVVGMVQAIKEMVGKEGNKMAFVALADDRAKLEVAFFGEVYSQVKPHLQMDRLLVVEGHLAPDFRSGDLRMRADQAMDVAGYRERFAKCLAIEVQQPLDAETARALILRLQQGPRGQLPIQVTFVQSEFCVPMKMTSQWLFCPQDSWLEGFDDFSAQVSATLVY